MPYKDPQKQKEYQAARFQRVKNAEGQKDRQSRCKKELIERNKKIVEEARSSGCQVCGYNRCKKALEFHHKSSIEKDASISKAIRLWGTKKLADEIQKCILLCANCHREVHDNMITLQ